MEKKLSKDQVKAILEGAPKGTEPSKIIDGLVARGYTLEGFNEKPTVTQQAKDVATGFVKGAGRTVLGAGQDLQTIGQGALLASGVSPETVSKTGFQSLDPNSPKGAALEEKLAPTNEAQKVGGYAEFGAELLAGGGAKLIGKGAKALAPKIVKVTKPITESAGKVADVVKSTVDEALFTPNTEEATKTVLNPFADLAKAADKNIEVSIPVKSVGGKTEYTVKKVADVTPEEQAAYTDEISSLYNDFTKQGQKFLKDRSTEGGSPVEIVGRNIDNQVEKVNKLRQKVGKQMGLIEKASEGVKVPFNQSEVVQNFVLETADALKGKATSYGVDNGLTKEIQKLSDDILKLEKRGGSAKEALDFTRKWANYLENQKDKFGDFKENKLANTTIQRVVNDVKESARDAIAENNETYRTLIKGYRQTSKFNEEAKRLLGQEGLYGDTLKGAATAKRAIQSTSDAGARQFLKTLRDITGYDGIKEADVALKAMKDVGDYQGLSLLGVLSDVEGGLIGTAKNVVKKLTPSEKTRTEKYIKKGSK